MRTIVISTVTKVSTNLIQAIFKWVYGSRFKRQNLIKDFEKLKSTSSATEEYYRAIALTDSDLNELNTSGSVTISQGQIKLLSWTYDLDAAQEFIRDHLKDSEYDKTPIIYSKEIPGSDVIVDIKRFTKNNKKAFEDLDENNEDFWEIVDRECEVLTRAKPYMFTIDKNDLIKVRR